MSNNLNLPASSGEKHSIHLPLCNKNINPPVLPKSILDTINAPTQTTNEINNNIDIESEFAKLEPEKHSLKITGQLNSLENEISTCLSEEIFAAIHAPKIIKHTQFEGINLADSAMFFKKYLRALNPEGQNSSIDDFIKSLDNITGIRNEMIPIRGIKETHQKLAKDIALRIFNLKNNESYVMPGGWCGQPSGHAMLYKFTKLQNGKFEIVIYNTGEGVGHYHFAQMNKNKIYIHPIVTMSNIPAEEIFFADGENELYEDFFLALIEKQVHLTKYDHTYNDVYGIFNHLTHYITLSSQKGCFFIHAQQAGTCAWNVLQALLYTSIPTKEYKQIAFDLKLNSLVTFFKKT